MEENNNVNVNENENFETEGSGTGKLIGLIVAAGAGAFALGQTVGSKIGSPVQAMKNFNTKRKVKKAEKKLAKLQKEKEKNDKALAEIKASQAVKEEETPATTDETK